MKAAEKWKSEIGDAELVGMVGTGDNDAFDVLVKRYQRAVYAVAFAILSDSESARDVLQDTFISAYCSLERLEDPSRFGAWVYAIARNRARGYYRTSLRKRAREISLDDIEFYKQVEMSEKTEIIRCALASLTQLQADTVTLHYMEGYSINECAALLQTSAGNIKRRLYDARQKLKKELTYMIRKHLPEFALPKDFKVVVDTTGRICSTQVVLEDLSQLTGVTFEAGKDQQDWQVRGRKLNIIAKNVPLTNFMESIANVLNCEWGKTDGDPPIYRLFMDEETQRKAEHARKDAQERFDAEMTRRRREFVERMLNWQDVSPEELERMKIENPCRYSLHIRGSGHMYKRLFTEIPRLADSTINRVKNVPFYVMDLPKKTRDLIRHVIDERFKYRGYHGSRDGQAFPEEYDINCREASLWFEIVPRDFVWDITQNWDLGGVGVFVRDRFFYIEDMLVEGVGRADFHAKTQLVALESGKTFHEVKDDLVEEEYRAALDTARDLEMCYSGSSEPAIEEDDMELLNNIRVKLTGDTLADYQAALAEAGGVAVVSDFYLARRPEIPMMGEKNITLREVLDTIAGAYGYNWVKRGQMIEFRDKKWFTRTDAQIPEEQVEKWRKSLRDRASLSLDEYAEIAVLSNSQIEESLMPDELLFSTDIFGWPLVNARPILKLYHSLDDGQKLALFSSDGLDIRSLSKDKLVYAMQIFGSQDEKNEFPKILEVSNDPNRWLVLKATQDVQECGQLVYSFLLQASDGGHLREWKFLQPMVKH